MSVLALSASHALSDDRSQKRPPLLSSQYSPQRGNLDGVVRFIEVQLKAWGYKKGPIRTNIRPEHLLACLGEELGRCVQFSQDLIVDERKGERSTPVLILEQAVLLQRGADDSCVALTTRGRFTLMLRQKK